MNEEILMTHKKGVKLHMHESYIAVRYNGVHRQRRRKKD